MTDDELTTLRRRRGYWLRLAREHANLDQNSAAQQLGLSAKSGTTILAWEKGIRSPSADQLHQLARLYSVPVSLFTEPRPTDEDWLDQLAIGAAALEREDWEGEVGEGRYPASEDEPGASPRRRSA